MYVLYEDIFQQCLYIMQNAMHINMLLLLFRHDEEQYLEAVCKIIAHGNLKSNRTGIDTKSVFGMQHRYCLRNGMYRFFSIYIFILPKNTEFLMINVVIVLYIC